MQILNIVGLYSYNLIVITLFTSPIIFLFRINLIKKLIFLTLISFMIFILYIFGNYEINKNKERLADIDNKTYVKIISPNFDLKYGLNKSQIQERLKKLIRYSEPDKEKKTLFIWPEGVFSGYSYNDIQFFKSFFLQISLRSILLFLA